MNNSSYKPDFPGESWTEKEKFLLEPFVTNLDGLVAVLRNLPPEILGALCSRTSRAKGSLSRVLLNEYFLPILNGEDKELAKELEETIKFLHERGFKNILNNQRAQSFYAKWLSQYGDDSIAQMTGTHIFFWGISQVAMKFIEDQRVGLEPIEKSTRYVNFGEKIGGNFLYYKPRPDLERLGLLENYKRAMDRLFETYVALQPRVLAWLKENFDEKEMVLEKKSFDVLRGLLPMATLGQVAFRGNAQAFEYLINRSLKHRLGELRWIAEAAKAELDKEIPSLLLRVSDEKSANYQKYLAERRLGAKKFLDGHFGEGRYESEFAISPAVRLVEFDPESENKIIAGIIFPEMHIGWRRAMEIVHGLSREKKEDVLTAHFTGRDARWQKVGRAFENSYLRFEIVMNIGAYRDLHRHRMLTQDRQIFSVHHGYDVPAEVQNAGVFDEFSGALESAANVARKIEEKDATLAQYAVPLAYRMRFYQWQNFRELFWETELRTISQGHPDYRAVEQEKYRLVKEKFPLIAKFMLVDVNDYKFARRGTEEAIAGKEKKIVEGLKK